MTNADHYQRGYDDGVEQERVGIAKELGRMGEAERLRWVEGYVRAYHLTRDPCPTCEVGPSRETVGMVCQTCGHNYAQPPTEPTVCFAWVSPAIWPHAVPDIHTLISTIERAKVTCASCLWALGSQKSEPPTEPTAEPPAADVVRAIERELDDADQFTDTLERPNCITVWGVRRALLPFGGKPHRWPMPAEVCAECEHRAYDHDEECTWPECDCLLSEREAQWGRDEAMDDAITQAIWEDAVANGEPWTEEQP